MPIDCTTHALTSRHESNSTLLLAPYHISSFVCFETSVSACSRFLPEAAAPLPGISGSELLCGSHVSVRETHALLADLLRPSFRREALPLKLRVDSLVTSDRAVGTRRLCGASAMNASECYAEWLPGGSGAR
jgi:hypothetical protein